MKKIIYFLLIIILLAGIAGGGYMLYNHFKKTDEPKPSTETNILTESQALLKNHASITFGTGDSAWTISTADKVAPIYIDDLRAPGKGFNIGHSNDSGYDSINIPIESDITIAGDNLLEISITGSGNVSSLNYSISRKNSGYIWNNCASTIYENILYSFVNNANNLSLDSEVARIETAITNEGYKPGDNYLLGCYQFTFFLQDIDKYGEDNIIMSEDSASTLIALFINIPVYYRVK